MSDIRYVGAEKTREELLELLLDEDWQKIEDYDKLATEYGLTGLEMAFAPYELTDLDDSRFAIRWSETRHDIKFHMYQVFWVSESAESGIVRNYRIRVSEEVLA